VVVGHEAVAGLRMVVGHGYRIDPVTTTAEDELATTSFGHDGYVPSIEKATTGIEPVCKALQASA
jgi:hypothetical protein